eukprot:RCo020975
MLRQACSLLLFGSTAPRLFQASAPLLKNRKPKGKSKKILIQLISAGKSGSFRVFKKYRVYTDQTEPHWNEVRYDPVLSRPVVWTEAKLKSGYAVQNKDKTFNPAPMGRSPNHPTNKTHTNKSLGIPRKTFPKKTFSTR